MQVPITGNTQNQRLNKALSEIKADVTEKDREAAMDDLNCTSATISRYLNGKAKDNDLATNMLTFFKNRIAARDKEIA